MAATAACVWERKQCFGCLKHRNCCRGAPVAPARRERETLVSVEQLGLHTCYTYREVACEKSGRKGRDATPGSHSTS